MKEETAPFFLNGKPSRQTLGILSVILLALLICFPWNEWPRSRVPVKAKRTGTEMMVKSIASALEAFRLDYAWLPTATSTLARQDTDSDTSTSEGLTAALLGTDVTINPRKVNYLADVKVDRTLDADQHSGGLVMEKDSAGLVDPWGHPFHIRLDTDGDGFVDDPRNPGAQLRERVLVWSAGKDGDANTWDDNVSNWTGN
jgi:hypothetical protein